MNRPRRAALLLALTPLLAGCRAPEAARPDDAAAGPSAAERTGASAPGTVDVRLSHGAVPFDGGEAAPGPEAEALLLPHARDPEVDHLAEAGAAQDRGDEAAALDAFRKAAYDLGSYEAYLGVGRTARRLSRHGLALRALAAAAEADPARADPLVLAARVHLARGEAAAGLKVVDAALRREPGRTDALNVRGRLEMARGQYDRALLAFRRVVDLEPAHPWAWNNMGYLFLLTGRHAEAVEALETATGLAPVTAYMFNNLGLAYERSGRIEDARRAYEAALDLEPGHVKAGLNLDRIRAVALAR